MVFFCDRCHAKYSIPDKKLAGKNIKLKCKQCQSLIQLRDEVVFTGEKQSKPRLQLALVGAVDSSLLALLSLANHPRQIISCCVSCGEREYIQHPKNNTELPWGKPWSKCAQCLRSQDKGAPEIKYKKVYIESAQQSYLVTVYDDLHNAMLGLLSQTPAHFDAVVLVASTKEQRFLPARFGCLLGMPVIIWLTQSPDDETAALEVSLRESLLEGGLRADEVPFLYHELSYDDPNTATELFSLLDQHTAPRTPPQDSLFLITGVSDPADSLSGHCLQREFYPDEIVSIVGAPEGRVLIKEETGTAKVQLHPRYFSISPAPDVRLRPGKLLSSNAFGPLQDTLYALICYIDRAESAPEKLSQQSGSFYFYSPWIFLERKPSPRIELEELSIQVVGRLKITTEKNRRTGSFLASVALSDSVPLSPGLRFIFVSSGMPLYALGVVIDTRRFK